MTRYAVAKPSNAPGVEIPSTRREPIIRFIDVHTALGGRPILQGLNLTVYRGETLAMIGGSGQGKSVTLRHIVGILKPDRGRVIVDGMDIGAADGAALDRIHATVGYCFQGSALLGSLSVYDNVALPLRMREGAGEAEVRERVMRALGVVGLMKRVALMPSDLSGGMRKRVGLARAIVTNPQIILYDEPTSGLDPVTANVIHSLIEKLHRTLRVTSVIVTHDMEAAYKVADRIALLHAGRVVAAGTSAQIRSSADPTVRQFIHGEACGPLSEKDS